MESVTLPICTSGNCRSRNVFTPRSVPANLSVMYRFIPCTTDTTAIRNITPMNTPMMENALLSFCARMVSRASRTASRKAMLEVGGGWWRLVKDGGGKLHHPPELPRSSAILLISQRFHRIEPRGLAGRVDTEQQSRHRRQSEGQNDGAEGDVRWHGRGIGEHQRHEPADEHADDAAQQRQSGRFHEELPQDLPTRGAERLADPDLPGALRDRDHHDGDHPDTADQQADQ